ncbi:MAG: glycosyltransferase family 2 protein [Bacteroidales bacterium]|jgi:cellulose synthase/poly-beta-1,6-N-acetylglucosamine synthase-like glycosyltransferase|nr:glycosyltransferase family 2 protein [Bacteroidales bacterium]
METISNIFLFTVNHVIFILTCLLFAVYLTLSFISAAALRKYLRKNSYVDYHSIILAPLTPSVSVIAPAYNEERSIVENIRALMSLYYNNFEVIVVNDGSTDGTFNRMMEAYELERVSYFFDYRIPCERIRGVYKSHNRSFKKLTVIDKVNGGKADALNAGINISKKDLICSIDVDSIMEPDALLKMVKPFMEETGKEVIGAGGVIRIANSCVIEDGQIKEIRLPNEFLPRVQVLEYTRAFLLARMAWGKLNGLLLISGALGMFDKEVVIQCGGYSTKTVGEDMELVVRMRRYMAEHKRPYQVVYIPDPLVWTEVPATRKILARQRNRWTRGTLETLRTHKKLFFNYKYGIFGMLGYTYWFFFEWLAPILEFLGYLYFAYLIIVQAVNWSFFLLLLAFVYFFAVFLSTWAVLFEEKTFHKYKNRKDVFRLIGTAFFEPLLYHPLTVWWAMRGNIDYLRGVRSWGHMEREGFGKDKKTKPKADK